MRDDYALSDRSHFVSGKRSRQRLYYFASISTEDLNRRYHKKIHVGAASHKVIGVCHALRSSGVSAAVVTAQINSNASDLMHGDCVRYHHTSGVPYIKLLSIGSAVVKRLSSSVSFFLFAIRVIRSNDIALLYNFFPEYIPAALYLWAVGNPVVLDIEDGPRTDEHGFRGVVNRVSYSVLRRICAERFIVSSQLLGSRLNLVPRLAVYGVSTHFRRDIGAAPKFSGPLINVLYGGAIMQETGWGIFKDAVRHLCEVAPGLPVKFYITGLFDRSEIAEFVEEVTAKGVIEIVMFPDLSADEYRVLIEEMDVGLCLKLPSHGIGQTTFPSKVIEFAAKGLLIVSTSVSDVHTIFDADSAILLEKEDGMECAQAILDIINDRTSAERKASNGTALVTRDFSNEVVGARMLEFLNG